MINNLKKCIFLLFTMVGIYCLLSILNQYDSHHLRFEELFVTQPRSEFESKLETETFTKTTKTTATTVTSATNQKIYPLDAKKYADE